MAKTMHAAIVEQLGQPLVLREMSIPSPGPGQILVRTEADGRVHADIELQPLSAISDVFGRLERGDLPSRVAIDFMDAA